MSSVLFAALLDVEEWKTSLTIEQGMPDMTLPVPGYVAYGAIGIGGLLLLVALWRLVRLRLFRFFFTLVAALLISYYPVAYGLHWWLYKYNEEIKQEQGYTDTEKMLIKNLQFIDWGILGGGIFFGTILFYMTLGSSDDRRRYHEDDDDGEPLHLQRQAQSQPQARSRRRGRAGSSSPKNPFDFS